jgi:heme A synthase
MVELSGHPLWTVIAFVGALIAIGLQLRILRRSGSRVTWAAMIPLVLAAAAGGGITDRLENLSPWNTGATQCDHQNP